jgi:hypothetical protein
MVFVAMPGAFPRPSRPAQGATADYDGGHSVTGDGSGSPVMRVAPNVEPSSRIRSDGCIPTTCA